MSKSPYKSEKERRIVASFSLRDSRQQWFREALALDVGHEPSRQECEAAMREIAQKAIDDYIRRKIEMGESGALIA